MASYLAWFFETALVLHELLADTGSLYVHLDWHIVHYAKAVLDEIFGPENFRNEVVWKRSAIATNVATQWRNSHDTILFYSKTGQNAFNVQYGEYSESSKQHYSRKDEKGLYRTVPLMASGKTSGPSGRPWRGIDVASRGKNGMHWLKSPDELDRLVKEGKIAWNSESIPELKYYLSEAKGVYVSDFWPDIAVINSMAIEAVGFATQKPEALLERIVKASSNESSLVLDCFVGSGTTAAVAEKLNRRWIACDLGRFAIHTTRKRLLGIPNVKPFVVQNLGKYERQAWQVAEFPANGKDHLEEQREREAAYRKFILDLYHATPMAGYTWLHGTKSGRMVHVAAVDAPVTQADVKSIAREAWKAVGSGKDSPTRASVDILGWEFALEVNELAKNVAAESRVDVSFKKIPREVLDKKAIEQGDVRFFELGALSVDAKQKAREVTLKIMDFVIPTDDIPEEARKAIKHWSQLVDYWAVDWDYKNDTFHNQWQAYRTRKEPKIELETKYTYPAPGKYTAVVKVIDILGNDTTKTLEINVK